MDQIFITEYLNAIICLNILKPDGPDRCRGKAVAIQRECHCADPT